MTELEGKSHRSVNRTYSHIVLPGVELIGARSVPDRQIATRPPDRQLGRPDRTAITRGLTTATSIKVPA